MADHMTTQPADTIAAIRERVEKATPGPWRSIDQFPGGQHLPFADSRIVVVDDEIGRAREIASLIDNTDTRICDTANADFIAHARTDIPLLLSRYDEACGIIKRAADYLEALAGNLLRNDADMLLDPCDDPENVAAELQAFLTGTTPTDGLQVADADGEVRRRTLEEAARECETNVCFGEDPEWWLNATKKEVSVRACHAAAEHLRKLAKDGQA